MRNLCGTAAVGMLLGWFGPWLDSPAAVEPAPTVEKRASHACGNNAAWEFLKDGRLQCFTHKGRKTMVVEFK